MIAAQRRNLITVEDYLRGELDSPVKHEYLGGFVYAMAGARNLHDSIAGSVFGALYSRLRGKRCRPFNSDTKIRLRMPTHVRFYYPDASVICRPNPPNDSFQDDPVVIVEVVSRSTRRLDEGEKKDGYLTIPSLAVYLLVEQESPLIVAFRRTAQGFVREIYEGSEAVVSLKEVEAELPLAEVYEGIDFVSELSEDEQA